MTRLTIINYKTFLIKRDTFIFVNLIKGLYTDSNIRIKVDTRLNETMILTIQKVCQGCSVSQYILIFIWTMESEYERWVLIVDLY